MLNKSVEQDSIVFQVLPANKTDNTNAKQIQKLDVLPVIATQPQFPQTHYIKRTVFANYNNPTTGWAVPFTWVTLPYTLNTVKNTYSADCNYIKSCKTLNTNTNNAASVRLILTPYVLIPNVDAF